MMTFSIDEFRAVHHASLELTGITVIAGGNGCGKSTVSKMLYSLLDTATRYDTFVQDSYEPRVSAVMNTFVDLVINFVFQLDISAEERSLVFPKSGSPRMENWLYDVRNLFAHHADMINQNEIALDHFMTRSRKNLKLDLDGLRWHTPLDVVDNVLRFIKESKDKSNQVKFERPLSVLSDRLLRTFEEPVDLDKVHFTIDNDPLIKEKTNRLDSPVSIKRVFYIDTPWVSDSFDSSQYKSDRDIRLEHRTHLAKTLRGVKQFADMPLYDIIHEIVHGSAVATRTDAGRRFDFVSEDFGKSFVLFHCATGIKAFSILQMLLTGGKLDAETMLILDEPESNLHPQWVVEYARALVYLNKVHGVHFLISTHSADLVSALQAIAQKEKARDNTRFYLATKCPDGRCYDFEPQGFDIGNIFDSFNMSLDGIAKYGAEI